MKLFVNGTEADISIASTIKITLCVAEITDPEKGYTGYSLPFVIPASSINRTILGHCAEPTATETFNQKQYSARIEQDGCVIMSGDLYVMSYTENTNGYGEYSVAIIGPGKEWVRKAAETSFRSIQIDFEETITSTMIGQSWTWNKPVRFLPVERDSFAVQNNNSHLFPPVKILSFEDYHPFLHVRTIFEAIFAAAGYSIESEFINSTLFNSLYMSGNYPRKSIDGDKSKMDFLAGRFTDATATANSSGKVYADPITNLNTVGNIVQTANPREENNGIVLENVFAKNDCFTKIGDRIAFVPTHSVVVGFEFKIHYTANYYMISRDELKTFNEIYLWSGQVRSYKVMNTNKDRREEFSTGKTFTAIVFDHTDGDSYQFRYDELLNDQVDPENPGEGEVTTRTFTSFSSRTKSITITGSKPVTNPQIWIKTQESASYVLCEKDWALYDGHVSENGEVEVEITLRSSPERVMPSDPKYFDQIYFGGANPGMNFTLGKSTTIRPIFAGYPCEGSTVKFENVAAHEATALDFINAIRHMFNLTFVTDNLKKKVYVEPQKNFYRKSPIVDWSNKIDISKPISVSEPGSGLSQIYTMSYQTGDGAVTRWNRQNSEQFASYSWNIISRFAKNGEKISENPLFTASISVSGDFPDAPDALLTQAGNRESDITQDVEELNFPPKIVRYLGMAELPDSQKWGWPSYGTNYPFLAFHHTGENTSITGVDDNNNPNELQNDMTNGFSLCFDDRDDNEGLHRFYDKVFETYDKSKKVTAYICIKPEEIEALVNINSLARDFRALYRLSINGENALYRLEQVCDYDPTMPSAKCIFIKEI